MTLGRSLEHYSVQGGSELARRRQTDVLQSGCWPASIARGDQPVGTHRERLTVQNMIGRFPAAAEFGSRVERLQKPLQCDQRRFLLSGGRL